MSSFLGLRVQVQLQSGGSVKGKINSIDPSTGSLGIVQDGGSIVSVTRGEIADLKMLAEEVTTAPAPQAGQGKEPAVVSSSVQGKGGAGASATLTIPRAPAAMMVSHSDSGSRSKAGKNGKGKKGGTAGGQEAGPSSQTQVDGGVEAETLQGEKRKQVKTKKKPMVQQWTSASAGESDLDEDFDFDKALRSFDKGKIWQEIKTSDQTDPKSLLVSHNRINGGNDTSSRDRWDGRSGQDKLGLHEPVLSPSPTASHASLPQLAQSSGKGEEELQRARGIVLQREVENSKLRDEICELQAKAKLLEALGGVELQRQSEETDGYKWEGVIYESSNAHAEARRVTPKTSVQGALTFHLKTYRTDASRLRYLGVVGDKSDAAVVQRLPAQYRGEMGLKAESASIFVRRIKEAVQVK